jgi:V/A-type H+-transporting ATPase subunit I
MMTGFFPAKQEKKLAGFLNTFTAWFEISDPVPGDDVPVAFSNSPFAKLFEPILKLYALPGYAELDPTPFFAPFLMLFVGLCVGDVAYGLVIFLGALIAFFKAPKAFRPFASLLMVLGTSTIGAGLLLNGFFCVTIFGGPGAPSPSIFPSGAKYALFTAISTGKTTVYPMMSFALMIGFLQLMLAFVIRIVNKICTSGVPGAMVPLSFILFTIGSLTWGAHDNLLNLGIGQFTVSGVQFGAVFLAIPRLIGQIMFFAAFPLNIFFSNMDKKGGERVTMIIVDLYNGLTGIFGNILSYMRLFALGLTGGLLGGVFNMLAMSFITGKDGTIHWFSPFIIASVLLLVAGHALNFCLAIIGAGVHPLRLTFVEFLQNLDYSWSGKPYKPLARQRPLV